MRYALSLLALGAIVGCSHSRPRTMPAPSPTGPRPSEVRAQDSERSPGSSMEELHGVPLGNSSSLGAINRYDIASVEVLKDPASLAMYGIRGSNGVIVIRTKGS